MTGTPHFLRYSSERQKGRSSNRSLKISLSGASIPASLKRIDLTVAVAGQTFAQSFPAQINQTFDYLWDGKDALGRTLQGRQLAVVTVGYVYDGVYQQTASFGYNGNGTPITGDAARGEITLPRIYRVYVGTLDAQALALGGWALDVHHFYDPTDHVLYEGSGTRRSVQTINAGITTVAGNGVAGFTGDNVQATNTGLFFPFSATAAPNGELYVADTENKRVRKIGLNGIVTTVVGTGATCPQGQPCGDGGQALNAQLNFVTSIAFNPDGSYYLYDLKTLRVRKVAANGIITTVAGDGQACADPTSGCGDGGPATQAQLSFTSQAGCCSGDISAAPDGAFYLTDSGNRRVRRVGPDGIISTIAGNGRTAAQGGCTVVGSTPSIATNACLAEVYGLTAQPDGSVSFTDFQLHQIMRVTADGFIRVVAGTGACGNSGDGGPALLAGLCRPTGIKRGPDGALYFSDWNNARLRRIDAQGIITNYAATGVLGFSGDGGPAQAAQIRQSIGVSFGPDGALYIGEANNHRIRKVFPPLPGFNDADIAVPSSDGNELFKFNKAGRHLQTINTLTNAVKYTFGYDGAGRLTTVTDGDANVTTIQRNGSGNPTGILSPYNQLTTLTLDANGYFATITNPANEQNQFTYNSGGLLTLKKDPKLNQTTFTYDALGRLTRDDDAATGFQTLARAEAGLNYTVTHNTALNRTSTFQVQQTASGDQQRTTTLPSGVQEISLERQSGINTQTAPDGTITNEQTGGDPRWKLQAPLTTNTTITTPGALNFNSTFNRAVTLSNPADPLSLTTQTDTLTINGRTFTSAFTAASKTFLDTSPLNRQTTRVIDTQGRLTSLQFANLNPFAATYDVRGRLATTVFGTGGSARTSTFAYNPAGFPASITDALTRVTGFAYDNVGRVTQQTLPDTRVIGFGYDANGNLASLTPPSRPAHTFTYSPLDLLASYTAPGNVTTTFTYNLDRDLTNITRPDALQLNFAYDAAGRLQTLTTPSGAYGYGYSVTTGQLNNLTAPGGGALAYQYDGFVRTRQTWTGAVAGNVAHTFDNNFRVASQSVNNANTINFTYDNDDLLTAAGALTLTRNAQTGLLTTTVLSNVNDALSYNGFAELTGYTANFNATPLYATSFTRDKLSRITQKIETIGGVTTTNDYGYDLAGRLNTVTRNGVLIDTYSFDGNDNRASLNRSGVITNGTYDNQDRMTAYGAATYAYTANGEWQSKTVGAQVTQFGYDVLGNLRTVTLPDATQLAYEIDGQNRRIGKRINGTLTQGFLYQDQLEPVAELDGANNIVSRFVYGSRAHVPDYLVKGGVTYRVITDQVGSVRLVVNTTTGAIAQRLDYDEFGVVTFDSAPGFQPFGFAGGLYDTQTKLTRFGARDYDAETGRWTAKDRLLFGGSDPNLYSYAFADPVNQYDPQGEKGIGDVVDKLIDPFAKLSLDYINKKTVEYQNKIADLQKLINKLEKQKTHCKNKNKKKELQDLIDFLKSRISFYRNEIENLHGGGSTIDSINNFYKDITTPFGGGK